MSADLESRVAAGIRQLAGVVTPEKPPVDELLGRGTATAGMPVRHDGRRWRVGVAAGIVAAVGLLALTVATLTRDDGGRRTGPPQSSGSSVSVPPVTTAASTAPATAPSSSTSVTVPEAPHVVAEIPTTPSRGRLTFDGERIWQAGTHDNTLIGIDPATRSIVATFEGMPGPYLTTGDGALFVCGARGTVRVNPATGETTARSSSACMTAITYGAGSVWIGNGRRGLLRLDATTLEEQAAIPDVLVSEGIEFAAGSVWVAAHARQYDGPDAAARIDPSTNQVVALIETPDQPRLFEEGPDGVWVSFWPLDERKTGLVRIDPATNTIDLRVEQLRCDCWDMAVVGPDLVVGNYGEPLLIVDRATGALLDVFDPDPETQSTGAITSFAWDGALLWMRLERSPLSGQPPAIVAIDLGRYGS